jgi:hypothetical protein
VTDFAIRLWEAALAAHDRLGPEVEDRADDFSDEEALRYLAPMLAIQCSREYLARSLMAAEATIEALVDQSIDCEGEIHFGKAKVTRMTMIHVVRAGLRFLGRVRPGSFDEIRHFLGDRSPGMIVVYDDRKGPPEARYVAWPNWETFGAVARLLGKSTSERTDA